jgi:hypothetical protein
MIKEIALACHALIQGPGVSFSPIDTEAPRQASANCAGS